MLLNRHYMNLAETINFVFNSIESADKYSFSQEVVHGVIKNLDTCKQFNSKTCNTPGLK